MGGKEKREENGKGERSMERERREQKDGVNKTVGKTKITREKFSNKRNKNSNFTLNQQTVRKAMHVRR